MLKYSKTKHINNFKWIANKPARTLEEFRVEINEAIDSGLELSVEMKRIALEYLF